MARIRTIKPKFWDDIKIGKLSRDARLLYIGMWTFADDLGVVIAESIWLKSKIFPYDQVQIQQFEKWIQELVQNGFISLLSVKSEGFYYLPNFTRHQLINRPNVDDVNVDNGILMKALESIIDGSLINHGSITDPSVTIVVEDKEEDNIESKEILPSGSIKKTAPDVATRKQEFYNSLVPFANKHPKEMLRIFFDYWTELNPSGKKMKFEMQKTWEASKRLATWANRENFPAKIKSMPEKLSKMDQMLQNTQKLMLPDE